MMGVLRRYLEQGWFYSRLVSGVGCREWSTFGTGEVSFRNKFIIFLPCGLLVEKNVLKNERF